VAAFGIGANLSNYGGRGRSGTLSAYGEDVQKEATQELQVAADQETQRNAKNTQIEAQNKQGNQALGAAVGAVGGFAAGAAYGAAAGPYGALIGGVVGAIAGGLFAALWAVALVVSLSLPSTAEAAMMHFGQQKVLGCFDDIEQAKAARLKAEQELFTHSTRVT